MEMLGTLFLDFPAALAPAAGVQGVILTRAASRVTLMLRKVTPRMMPSTKHQESVVPRLKTRGCTVASAEVAVVDGGGQLVLNQAQPA
jgi:hypothetical protein